MDVTSIDESIVMVSTTQGKLIGSTEAFKSRKTGKLSSGLTLGSQRKHDLEAKAIDDKRRQEQAKTKEISRREEERNKMQKDLEQRVSEESNPNRNTDERRKVVNVGRPDTAKNPMDPRAKLVKQAEIKTKIIDENQEKSMTLQKYHNLPDSLVSAVTAVLEKKENPFQKDDKKPSKKDDDDSDKDVKAKKSEDDEDDEDDDKDTKSKSSKKSDDDDADKKIGSDSKKTKVEINPNLKMANEEVENLNEAAYHVRSVDPVHGGNEQMHGTHKSLKSAMSAAKQIKGGHVAVTHGPRKNGGGYEQIKHWVDSSGNKFKPDHEDMIHPKHGLSIGGNYVKEEVEDFFSVEYVDDLDNISEARTSKNYLGTIKNDEKASKTIADTKAKHGALRVRGRLGKNSPHAALYKGKTPGSEASPGYRKSRDIAMKHSQRLDLYRREDVEMIDELKTSTLTSYVKKAASHLDKSNKGANKDYNAYNHYSGSERGDKFLDRGNKHAATFDKRLKGIGKAVSTLNKRKNADDLGEESEQIDELSNKTMKSYSIGATRQLNTIKPAAPSHGDFMNKAAVGAHGDVAKKRAQGVELADKKIGQNIAKKNANTNEEVEHIDELSRNKLVGYINKASKDNVDRRPGLKMAATKIKKKMEEDVGLSDEEQARILAKLNEADDDNEEGSQHIVMQLRKAKSLGAGNKPIHFNDGSKAHVEPGHVQKALDMHGSMKKTQDKEDFAKKLHASHSSFKSAIGA